jgi:hypothetical protein
MVGKSEQALSLNITGSGFRNEQWHLRFSE